MFGNFVVSKFEEPKRPWSEQHFKKFNILKNARSDHVDQIHGNLEGFVKCVWIGLDWIGLDWIGLDWIGLDWIGLDWIGLRLGRTRLRNVQGKVASTSACSTRP